LTPSIDFVFRPVPSLHGRSNTLPLASRGGDGGSSRTLGCCLWGQGRGACCMPRQHLIPSRATARYDSKRTTNEIINTIANATNDQEGPDRRCLKWITADQLSPTFCNLRYLTRPLRALTVAH